MAEGKNEEKGRLRKTLETARHRIEGSVEKATGTQFRKHFEEFTEAVTTVSLGIHRDQSELGDRVSALEQSQRQPVTHSAGTRVAMWALGASIGALTLGAVALVLAVL